jgi:predicted nuclease of predicted toxin-antitoxin system
MRLLFDEQLSSRLPRLLSDIYPDSLHVESLGLAGAADIAIWQTAGERGCLLVSKDEDFHRLGVLHGAPPKVVWLRLGNCTTHDIADLLRNHIENIERFATEEGVAVLELGTGRTD